MAICSFFTFSLPRTMYGANVKDNRYAISTKTWITLCPVFTESAVTFGAASRSTLFAPACPPKNTTVLGNHSTHHNKPPVLADSLVPPVAALPHVQTHDILLKAAGTGCSFRLPAKDLIADKMTYCLFHQGSRIQKYTFPSHPIRN
jgi:hypothetical protein